MFGLFLGTGGKCVFGVCFFFFPPVNSKLLLEAHRQGIPHTEAPTHSPCCSHHSCRQGSRNEAAWKACHHCCSPAGSCPAEQGKSHPWQGGSPAPAPAHPCGEAEPTGRTWRLFLVCDGAQNPSHNSSTLKTEKKPKCLILGQANVYKSTSVNL